ncbi:hypothetical protein M758_UG259400 [Ceratodon purpureus]|nr:hypothetical protein M758_UG259400 [Ceratodon purpureus]
MPECVRLLTFGKGLLLSEGYGRGFKFQALGWGSTRSLCGRSVQGWEHGWVFPTMKEVEASLCLFSSISTLQAATNASAVNTAENGSQEMEQVETHFRFPEQFRMPKVNSGGAVTEEDLGRATLAAQYPENPTRKQKRDVKDLVGFLLSD